MVPSKIKKCFFYSTIRNNITIKPNNCHKKQFISIIEKIITLFVGYFTFLFFVNDERIKTKNKLFFITFRVALAIPRDSHHRDHITHSKCSMYAVNYTEILEKGITVADPSWPITHCKHGWEFNYTVIPYSTVATEVNW